MMLLRKISKMSVCEYLMPISTDFIKYQIYFCIKHELVKHSRNQIYSKLLFGSHWFTEMKEMKEKII